MASTDKQQPSKTRLFDRILRRDPRPTPSTSHRSKIHPLCRGSLESELTTWKPVDRAWERADVAGSKIPLGMTARRANKGKCNDNRRSLRDDNRSAGNNKN
jgi:hypothetical protein